MIAAVTALGDQQGIKIHCAIYVLVAKMAGRSLPEKKIAV
jgi:hypothetical protein